MFPISLIIRGDKDEHAILCSEDKTYDLKIADTSNLLLFVPGCKTPDQLPDSSTSQLMHAQVTEEVVSEDVILFFVVGDYGKHSANCVH